MPDGETQSPPVDDYDDDGVQDKRPYVVVSPLVVVYRLLQVIIRSLDLHT
jgi:hypothetical protein